MLVSSISYMNSNINVVSAQAKNRHSKGKSGFGHVQNTVEVAEISRGNFFTKLLKSITSVFNSNNMNNELSHSLSLNA